MHHRERRRGLGRGSSTGSRFWVALWTAVVLCAAFLLLALLGSCAHAQSAKPVTLTLSAEQVQTLRRALIAADVWFAVRAQTSPNSFDGHGFELQRSELKGLADDLARQEQAATAPAPAPAADAPKSE